MIDANGKLVRGIAIGAVVGTAIIGMSLNGHYGWNLGTDLVEKWQFMTASISLDLIKVTALGFAFNAIAKNAKLKGGLMIAVWLGCATWGVMSALGVTAQARNIIKSEQQADNDDYARDKARYDEIQDHAKELRKTEAWKDTQACTKTDGTSKKVKQSCDMYYSERVEAEALQPKLRGGSVRDTDAQATSLKRVAAILGIRIDRETISELVPVFLALLLEFVSSVGMYGASKTRLKTRRRISGQSVKRKTVKPKLAIVK